MKNKTISLMILIVSGVLPNYMMGQPPQNSPPPKPDNWIRDQDDQTDTLAIPLDSSEEEEKEEEDRLNRLNKNRKG